jgi:hypothetical protein
MENSTLEYYGYNIKTNENHTVTPSNTFSNITIDNADQEYTSDMNGIYRRLQAGGLLLL